MDGVPGAPPRHSAPGISAASTPARPSVRNILCVSRSAAGREFLANAFAAEDVETRVGGPELVPDNVKDFLAYDCVVLSNIPRASLGDARMRALARYVRDYGGGLVVLGGPGSLGAAYRGTPLEAMLPVTMGGGNRFGKREALPLCIVLLVDKSGSMGEGFGGKMLAARRAVGELLTQMQSNDMVGIIPFDSSYSVLVPLGPVGDDRERIVNLVRRLQTGGDTRLAGPLEEALRQFQDSACRVKRVILITDGMTKDISEYDYRGLIADYTRNGVAISAMDIGRKDGSHFLRALALGTGGDYTHLGDVDELPLALLRDARKSMVESGLISGSVVPKLGRKSAILEEIRRGQIPEVRGYVILSARPGADVALYSDLRGEKDPLLASWRFGRGRTVVWASDVEGRWSGGSGAAERSAGFWARVLRWAGRARR